TTIKLGQFLVISWSYVADFIMWPVLFLILFHLIPKEFKNPYHSFDSTRLSFHTGWKAFLSEPD
ncbi:MAG: hypothetical protein PVI36_11230, partial [Desulfobacterales bacterium]